MSALPRILLLAHRPAPPAVTSAPPAPPPAACSTRYLGAHVGVSQGAAGSTYVVLVFKNLNNYPCTLYGYPGVALDAGVPVTQVGLAAAEDPATPRERVTLGPYGTADALLRIGSDLVSTLSAEAREADMTWAVWACGPGCRRRLERFRCLLERWRRLCSPDPAD